MTTSRHSNNTSEAPGKKRPSKASYLFHPFEIAFCGYSNSGKTTLITKLIHKLSGEFDIGYVKNDVHRFEMDVKGKDTSKAWESGATQVLISDPRHSATLYKDGPDLVEMKTSLLKQDFVFLEGYKNSLAKKIIVLDDKCEILKSVTDGSINNVLAFVGAGPEKNNLPLDVPYFQRDNIDALLAFVRSVFNKKIMTTPLFGLVLTGGHSTRMNTDKALLKYSEKSQAEVCYELLDSHCDSTFLSSRSGQWADSALGARPQIHDTYLNLGPMGGVLSAMQAHPKAAWLVVACDLPFLDHKTIHFLIKNRKPFKVATCFNSEHDGLPEPLCTIFEPKSFVRLLQFLSLGYKCPRKALINSPINLLTQVNPHALDNANTKLEYKKAKSQLNLEARP